MEFTKCNLYLVSVRKRMFFQVLDKKASSAWHAKTENRSPNLCFLLFFFKNLQKLHRDDCFEDKHNAAIGVFLQALVKVVN